MKNPSDDNVVEVDDPGHHDRDALPRLAAVTGWRVVSDDAKHREDTGPVNAYRRAITAAVASLLRLAAPGLRLGVRREGVVRALVQPVAWPFAGRMP